MAGKSVDRPFAICFALQALFVGGGLGLFIVGSGLEVKTTFRHNFVCISVYVCIDFVICLSSGVLGNPAGHNCHFWLPIGSNRAHWVENHRLGRD